MKTLFRKSLSVSTFFFFLLYSLILSALEPDALYLTWIGDPARSMTVVWQTKENEPLSEVYYRGRGSSEWSLVKGWVQEAEAVSTWVHVAEIEGLQPDGGYEFRVGDGEVHWFRTLPEELEREVRIAVGGDAFMTREPFVQMCREIAAQDPDFAVVGGDIAYTIWNHRSPQEQGERWTEFFSIWKREMAGEGGRYIPLVPVVGNHDVSKRKEAGEPLFYSMFPFPERGISYRALDCGSYLSLVLLDSGHSYPVEGKQTLWLKETLEERAAVPYLMAAYHVAAYPSFYPFDGKVSIQIRENWVPLFEQYGAQAAFEHHNHCYKRAFRLKGGKKDEGGVLYLGDGSWSVPPRRPKEGLWYIAKAAAVNSYFLVRLGAEGCRIEPRGLSGLIDTVQIIEKRNP